VDREGLSTVPEAAPSVEPDAPSLSMASPTARGASFRALRSKPFRLYFAGQVASASGTFLQTTAIGWLVLQLTGSASSLGLVLAAGGLPSLLLGPWGGTIVDRVDLRKLLIGT
jgi:predicted MFS family arabinose efflux permease